MPPERALPEAVQALVIGGGPAGLMAAEEMARAGLGVVLAEAKPTIGRKFLMAGKSGLNLTRDQPLATFSANYAEAADWLAPMLADFGPEQVQDWARGLGQEVFVGSTGRVFPVTMKAAPLLRAWAGRLAALGVQIRTRWRWHGFEDGALAFETTDGLRLLAPQVVVLAMGGASWARLGSDGAWASVLADQGIEIAPFKPSNLGVVLDWSAPMAAQFGQPLKPLRLSAGSLSSRGEVVISARGLEGGGIYPLTPALRAGAALVADLAPNLTEAALVARLAAALAARPRDSLAQHLRKAAGLGAPARALLAELARPLPRDSASLAARIKALPIAGARLGPMDQAISTAGGICRSALDAGLGVRVRPGIFAAGEMLDWEAPTGGYLLTACLATGRAAGRAAAALVLKQGA